MNDSSDFFLEKIVDIDRLPYSLGIVWDNYA